MQFSIFHITMGRGRTSDRQVYDDFLSDVALAERLPYHTFWLAEHHFDSNFCMSPSPNLLLAAAAVLTKRINIGTSINILPFHNPVRMAEEVAMLDLLSNGRYQWGIGRGITGGEFAGFGIDPAESLDRFREAHDFLLKAWATGDMQWDGHFFKVPAGTHLAPAITQKPHPPVWVTAQSPSSVEWAAERGYPIMQVSETLETSRTQLERYRATARKAGKTPDERGEIIPCRYVFVAETEQEAREIGGRQIIEWWHEFTSITAPKAGAQRTKGYEYWQDKKKGFIHRTSGMDLDEMLEGGLVLVGTPKQVIRQIERHIEAFETRHILCDFWRAGKSRAERQSPMTLFGERVIPYFVPSGARLAATA